MENDKNYIKQIKAICEKENWTQSEFAQNLDVTFASVNRWLKGHAKPQPGQIARINQLYKNIIGITPLADKKLRDLFLQIEESRKKFSNIKKILSDQRVIDDFLLELTYNSDAIEGSTFTRRETEAVIFDKAIIKDKSLSEHLEAVNHAQILRDIFSGKIFGPVDEKLVKAMHKELMQGIRLDAGEYSKYRRAIRGIDLVLPYPEDIPEEMAVFFAKVNKIGGDPVGYIAKMHADFEAIHPFGDGNGRIGRLIMIIQLIEAGFAPCVVTVSEKSDYYECLEYAQKKSPTHLTQFIMQAMLKGYAIIERVIGR